MRKSALWMKQTSTNNDKFKNLNFGDIKKLKRINRKIRLKDNIVILIIFKITQTHRFCIQIIHKQRVLV